MKVFLRACIQWHNKSLFLTIYHREQWIDKIHKKYPWVHQFSKRFHKKYGHPCKYLTWSSENCWMLIILSIPKCHQMTNYFCLRMKAICNLSILRNIRNLWLRRADRFIRLFFRFFLRIFPMSLKILTYLLIKNIWLFANRVHRQSP